MASVYPQVDAIVIGASAGGVDALRLLLPTLAADAPPVLVVLHRGARQAGVPSMAAVFARHCRMAVDEAWHGQPLVAGQVLLAPADYHLLVDPGPVAALSTDEPVLWSRPAIDPTLESASMVFGPRLLAIVLTGASADGAAGALAVRSRGGEVWVQDPLEAVAGTMPQATLNLAGADQVLRLQDMGRRLAQT